MSTSKRSASRVVNYVRECKEEMGKVTWPTRSETIKYSVLTIAIALGTALFFAGSDWILSLGLEQLIRLSS